MSYNYKTKYEKHPLKTRLIEIETILNEITNIAKSPQLLDVHLARNKHEKAREELEQNIQVLNKEKTYILGLRNKDSTRKKGKKTILAQGQSTFIASGEKPKSL